MIALMYTTVCMETDIYVPAFPDMKSFFNVTSEAIQKILSYNFIGIFLGSLVFGPLSDAFGRQKAIRVGLGLFALASWGCLLFKEFNLFLLCRFFQGIGAAAPMVITFAMILETYEPKKVAQLCGGLNLFITGVMACAPILGSYLNIYYGWQFCFGLIALLATLSFIGSFIFIPETLALTNRTRFVMSGVVKNYGTVLTSFPFMAAAFVCYLMFAGLMVFTANLSLIFIESLGVSKSTYGYYQASVPAAFALISLLSIWIVGRFGINKTKFAGMMISILGAIALFLTALIFSHHPQLICASMIIFTIGITLAAPIYGMESANVFPQMRGIATGMSNALRHMVVAGVVGLGSFSFNGSIMPVAFLILAIAVINMFLARQLTKKETPVAEESFA